MACLVMDRTAGIEYRRLQLLPVMHRLGIAPDQQQRLRVSGGLGAVRASPYLVVAQRLLILLVWCICRPPRNRVRNYSQLQWRNST